MRSAYGHHANLHILSLCKNVRTGCDSGTGGDDVVDKQNVPTLDCIRAEQGESVFHVLSAVGMSQFGLTYGVSRPLYNIVANLNI